VNPREFRNPPARYRTSPFWSWNDRLEAGELRRQIREFADRGFGGFFMHSRVGLRTEYLSGDWMKMIRACLVEGRKHHLESWLYDEDKWPSGFAGGRVPAQDESYRQRALFCRRVKPEAVAAARADAATLAVFAVRPAAAGAAPSYRPLTPGATVAEDEEPWVFDVHAQPRSNWYNGESYVDLMNPRAVEEFLRLTEDAYARRFGRDFGPDMPGIFTDEPNYFSWFKHPETLAALYWPWTGELPAFFQRLNGYDLLSRLPELAFYTPAGAKLRHDFYLAATRRFREAWSVPSFQRCGRLGLQWTGHFLAEDSLPSQISVIGAAMPHYEFMQVPGIDHLGRNIDDALTLKQCASVAHQFGRNRVLCEIFGVSGHSMTFEDQKWIADFHFALGITFLCQHLVLYTMTGDRKRDYPPTFSYHQPYWPDYRRINDYFGRAAYLTQQGDFGGDILVLHPIASAWTDYIPYADEWPSQEAQRRVGKVWNDQLVAVMQNLLELHRDFDFGDEMILEKHAAVSDCLPGLLAVAAKGLYRLVVVPPSQTWSMATVVLLRRFLDAGGKVLFVGQTPTLVDAEPNEKVWQALLGQPGALTCGTGKAALEEALAACHRRRISVADAAGAELADLYVHERIVPVKGGARHVFFLSNKHRTIGYRAVVRVPVAGEVTRWDLVTGDVCPLPGRTRKGETVLTVDLPAAGSFAFTVATDRRPKLLKRRPPARERTLAEVSGPWTHRRLHPNSLTLDVCRFRLDGGAWQGPAPVWKARHAAFAAAGLGAHVGIQPWVLDKKGIRPGAAVNVDLRFEFASDIGQAASLFLVLEKARCYTVSVNGRPVATDVPAWQWDINFSKLDIAPALRKGRNVIELSGAYGLDMEIEDLYLVGDFAVRQTGPAAFALAPEPEALAAGDWVKQGYPFYAGNMRYESAVELPALRKGQRLIVRLSRPAGSLFRAGLNGKPMKTVWSRTPGGWEADLTSAAVAGTNALQVEVVGTLRNTFGPLHHTDGEALRWVGPEQFVDDKHWTDEYIFAPYGLLEPVQLLARTE
jgi:hypothetical protein